MKRSSKMVPFVVIIILSILIAIVITLKSSFPSLMDVYDVLGITDLKNTDSQNYDSIEESDINFDQDNTGTIIEDINKQDEYEPADNVIVFNKSYIRTIKSETNFDKIDLLTTNSSSDYRVNIKTKISDTPLSGSINIAMYDERGVMVEQRNIEPLYYNSSSYCDEFNIDFHLEETKKYTLKISSDNLSGDYQISIYEFERDAGYNKETASPITIGEEVTAIANSTLSDWYVLDITTTAKYEILVHNINVGCRLYIKGNCENSSLFSQNIKSENSQKSNFFAREGDKVYIEIKPADDTANGKYIMSIKKMKDEFKGEN